ncbi:MAG: Uncharacterised protein [Opitutia bacterium UBA7350]|nr:MAG: Uncharacterised protein [Opitutae bacterium UBA7350]
MIQLFAKFHHSKGGWATFARFAFVGVTISTIDAGILYLLLTAGIDPYLGRFVSLGASMSAGYLLNRYFTFHHLETARALWHSLVRHYSVHAVGAAINIGVFSVVLVFGQPMGGEIVTATILPLLGVWIGGLAGMCFNFFFSKKLVYDN